MSIEEFAGIDVSQDVLDVAVGDNSLWQVQNDEEGLAQLTARLQPLGLRLVVLEATGGFEAPAAAALCAAGIPVAVVNPRQVHDFGRSVGTLAKTDRLDARVIARFAEAVKPQPRSLPDDQARELAALVARRRQVTEMIVMETNRLQRALPALRPEIRAHIDWLRGRRDQLDSDLDQAIQKSPVWLAQEQLYRSMSGVGPVTAWTLIAELPELGGTGSKRIASLVGVAPFNRDSGKWRGKRTIWGGRKSVRNALYMATVSATRSNPAIRNFYQSLLARGKERKTALVACMHKMLIILNAMARSNTPWQSALSPVDN